MSTEQDTATDASNIEKLRKEMRDEVARLEKKYNDEVATLKSQTGEAMDMLVSSEQASAEMQEAYLVQRNEIRKMERNRLLLNFKSAAAKRGVGLMTDLQNETDDIKEAFSNILPPDTDPFGADVNLDTLEIDINENNKEQVANAIKTSLLIVGEMRKRMHDEVLAFECAENSTGGWGAVRFLENKDAKKMAGENIAEKEEKLLRIKKADEEYKKHQKGTKFADNNRKFPKSPLKKFQHNYIPGGGAKSVGFHGQQQYVMGGAAKPVGFQGQQFARGSHGGDRWGERGRGARSGRGGQFSTPSRRLPLVCYRCEKSGHFAYQCTDPAPKKN